MKKLFILGLVLLSPLLFSSGQAHELETGKDGKVAALIHIEPDDQPIAGQIHTVWFELTERGGKKIDLSSCKCTLKVYPGAYKAAIKPQSQPILNAGKVGEGQGKPSARVNFKTPGAYTLVLEGKPKMTGAFPAFRLEFVTRADKKE